MKNNKFVRVIKTRKYKDINLYLRFSLENKNNILQKACLLSKLLGEVTNKYPTKLEMTACKDMLYGISCDCTYKATGDVVSFYVHYSFINPKFVDASIDEYNSFIKETLFNTIIEEKNLNEAKTNIIAALRRNLDKPAALSMEKFIGIVAKDNKSFGIHSRGDNFIKVLEKIDLDDLKQAYKYIINKAQLYVYLCGDLEDNDITKLCTYRFDNRDVISMQFHKNKYVPKKTITDKKDISQTYLSVAYTVPINRKHKDYYAWLMGNYLLGVGPTSLLFSEIREKMSLCYSIDSTIFKNSGLVRISTSIDGKNKDIAIKQIMAQVDRLANKDVEEERLVMTKAYICNALLSIYDDLDSLVDFTFGNDLYNENITIEELCEKLNEVTMQDISKVYKKYVPYFNHILLGSKHE